MDDDVWQVHARNLVRGEMVKRGVSAEDLADRLAEAGAAETAANLRTRISRGRFSAGFLLQVLSAIGVGWVEVPAPPTPVRKKGAAERPRAGRGLEQRGR